MKITKSQLKEIIREEILKESNNPMEIFNKAKGVAKEYNKLKRELDVLKNEYESAQKVLLSNKLKEYTDILSNKLSQIAKVSNRSGNIILKLHGGKNISNPSIRSNNELLNKVHDAIGENGVFKAIDITTNSYTEIQSMTLGFTQQYVKSTQNLPSWSSLKI